MANTYDTCACGAKKRIVGKECRACWQKNLSQRMKTEYKLKREPLSEERKRKISESNKKTIAERGSWGFKKNYIPWNKDQRWEDSFNWKGDEVGYQGLHRWVRLTLQKPTQCEHCSVEGHYYVTKKRKIWSIQWANKSHEYKRDISDWLALCISCHRFYDSAKNFNFNSNKENRG